MTYIFNTDISIAHYLWLIYWFTNTFNTFLLTVISISDTFAWEVNQWLTDRDRSQTDCVSRQWLCNWAPMFHEWQPEIKYWHTSSLLASLKQMTIENKLLPTTLYIFLASIFLLFITLMSSRILFSPMIWFEIFIEWPVQYQYIIFMIMHTLLSDVIRGQLLGSRTCPYQQLFPFHFICIFSKINTSITKSVTI